MHRRFWIRGLDGVERKIEALIASGELASQVASADEIGAAAGFLASPAASYINGINLPVDGGRLASL